MAVKMMQAMLLALVAFLLPCAEAFSWRADRRIAIVNGKSSDLLQQPSHTSSIYDVALNELQQLESEPLCHRIAARLLVNNCQLVDGKNEASILMDSGRLISDFVDTYAASLAICDLERGSFQIPAECTKFREPALSQIAITDAPQLHVAHKEIKLCLGALGTSDSAWGTWISYRHKTLRFCEAARVDNQKDQNILLYQRLTKVISKLMTGVEAELQKKMDDLDERARQTFDNLAQLLLQVDQLRDGLERVETYLSGDLENTLRRSSESAQDNLQQAEVLQQFLIAVFARFHESNTQLVSVHEQSLQHIAKRTNDDIGALAAIIATAVTSTNALQQQIERSNQNAELLAKRQDTLEQNMDRLIATTEKLSTNHEHHTLMLTQAANMTSELLDTLEETSSKAQSLNRSLIVDAMSGSWWPYVLCPAGFLILGSYGLPPSAGRNIGLLATGEVIGFLVSVFNNMSDVSFPALEALINTTTVNTTVSSL
ncbi:hypothetical protein B0T25DRAFT_547849 [Lasiosphaeria hispida]|uniref:Nuclear membrane fusion protein Kar5 n=1 Tax=Lasiosphaeria hispida TaxID=260671 RepID=A0AAJ0HEJ9_9PEZI|nr:hypothetical protein B0T25DRAFT_547849 [Lasiosphaeria hispida]